MPDTKQDIRITKTLLALCKAMMDLLEKKNFQKITVNDICREAIVSRSTFYLHFEDKYKLMLFCLQMERKKLEEAAQSMDISEYIHMALTNVYERKNAFRNFLKAEIDYELLRMFQRFFHDYFSDILTVCERQGTKLAGPTQLLSAFYANGLAGMVIWWIEQDFSLSIEEMALCQSKLLSDVFPVQVCTARRLIL